MTWEEMTKVLENLGMKIAPPDHPAYSEGVTISFISKRPPTPKPERPLNNIWPLYVPRDGSEDEIDSFEAITGRVSITFKYDRVTDFNGGLATVTQNEKQAVIDKDGKEVPDLPYGASFSSFSENMLAAQRDRKCGFVNKAGKLAIDKEPEPPKKPRAKLKIIKCDEKYGFVDKNGREVVAPKYDFVGDFNLGLAEVYIEDDGGYAQYGVINEYGEEIVPAMYESIEILNTGFTAVTGGYELLGLYNKEGKELFEPYDNNYEYIGDFKEGFAIVHKRNGTYTENGPPGHNFENVDYGFINEDGQEIACGYEYASDFYEGRAAVKKNGLCGFIDQEGHKIVELVYDEVRNFHDGMAAVCMNGKWGYVDIDGKVQSWSIQG